MFRLYRAIIRPYLKNRSISLSSTFGIPSVCINGLVITYVRNNYTIYVNTWDPKCTGKWYGSVPKIRPDDGSIEPKRVAALIVFLTIKKIGVIDWNNCTLYELWNTPGRIILTHCRRVTQICVFDKVKLGTSASSP